MDCRATTTGQYKRNFFNTYEQMNVILLPKCCRVPLLVWRSWCTVPKLWKRCYFTQFIQRCKFLHHTKSLWELRNTLSCIKLQMGDTSSPIRCLQFHCAFHLQKSIGTGFSLLIYGMDAKIVENKLQPHLGWRQPRSILCAWRGRNLIEPWRFRLISTVRSQSKQETECTIGIQSG